MLQGACVIPVVSTPEYPSSWPAMKVTPPGECAQVAGIYSNSSLQEGEESERLGLLKVLLGEFGYPVAYPQFVQLEQPDDGTLVITGLGERGTLIRQELSVARGTLECADEGLRIKVPSEVHPSDGGGWSRVFLSQSADGSLILREVDNEMLGAPGIAIVSHVRRWYRFSVESTPGALPDAAPFAGDTPAEVAVLELAPSCLKSRCLQRVIELDSLTLVYNHRFDSDLDPMRLPAGRFRIDTRYPRDSSYSTMEATLVAKHHYLLRSEKCTGNPLPVECPYPTERRLTWLEERSTGSIAGGRTWWTDITYREHPSPMVTDIPARRFWAANTPLSGEVNLRDEICDGVLIDRVVVKSDRVTINSSSPSGETRAVKFSVKLFFYNRGDGPRFVTPSIELVQDSRNLVVMEHPRKRIDRQSLETVTLRSTPVYEDVFVSLPKADPEPFLRVTVKVEDQDEAKQ